MCSCQSPRNQRMSWELVAGANCGGYPYSGLASDGGDELDALIAVALPKNGVKSINIFSLFKTLKPNLYIIFILIQTLGVWQRDWWRLCMIDGAVS